MWRGTNIGRHPWFGKQGRPQTDAERKATEDALVFKCAMEHKSGAKIPRCKVECISCKIWREKQ